MALGNVKEGKELPGRSGNVRVETLDRDRLKLSVALITEEGEERSS